jgi:hypothetical protein
MEKSARILVLSPLFRGVLSEGEYPIVSIVVEEDRVLNASEVLERLSDKDSVLKGFLDSGYICLSDSENLCTVHKDQIPSSLRKRIRKVDATKFFNPMMGSFKCNEEIDLVYFVESEPGHVVKKETFHVTSIPCDR